MDYSCAVQHLTAMLALPTTSLGRAPQPRRQERLAEADATRHVAWLAWVLQEAQHGR